MGVGGDEGEVDFGAEGAEGLDGEVEELFAGEAAELFVGGEVGFEGEEGAVAGVVGVFEDGFELAIAFAGGDDFAEPHSASLMWMWSV